MAISFDNFVFEKDNKKEVFSDMSDSENDAGRMVKWCMLGAELQTCFLNKLLLYNSIFYVSLLRPDMKYLYGQINTCFLW